MRRSAKVFLGLAALAGIAVLAKSFFAKKHSKFTGSPENLQLAWGEMPQPETLDFLYEERHRAR